MQRRQTDDDTIQMPVTKIAQAYLKDKPYVQKTALAPPAEYLTDYREKQM